MIQSRQIRQILLLPTCLSLPSTGAETLVGGRRSLVSGNPVARGLELGATGLHQPFPILMGKG
ncbi:MAG: hypothetical protein M2R45_04455 [Verrucomicrobia subdivision 3 bacterium]|nr:hypothetical protein [Limisphaerales bacterium]MCS1415014.1 hypothetical protein [Limisphaerales bacterium]